MRNDDDLRVVFVEAFWGGSHRAAAEGWARASRHLVTIEQLPARFWKWRMRGAAFEFGRRLGGRIDDIDVLFATDFVDLAHLLAFLPRRPPSVLYFHENQAAYPTRLDGCTSERDLQFVFTNLASAVAADRVAFNSAYQRGAFFEGVRRVLRCMPDVRPLWALSDLEKKSEVLPLGVSLSDIPGRRPAVAGPPVVLWNHRWEHDKDPETFFRVLLRLADRGIRFRLIVAGESFERWPTVFESARTRFADRIVHWGYVPRRAEYAELLGQADVTVSTALQENFGLSLLEAAFAGAHPLAPRRLSYPEVLPEEIHEMCLYENEADLETRLAGLLTGATRRLSPSLLRRLFASCRWEERAERFDTLVHQVFERRKVWYKYPPR